MQEDAVNGGGSKNTVGMYYSMKCTVMDHQTINSQIEAKSVLILEIRAE